MEEARREEDEPYEEDVSKIPAADMKYLQGNPLTDSRLRSEHM